MQVCRQADGFQKSLVSPEFGLKRLVSEAVETVADPVTSAVYKIHLVLIDAARCVGRCAALSMPGTLASLQHGNHALICGHRTRKLLLEAPREAGNTSKHHLWC